MNEKMNIPFSPPDVGEEEIKEVVEALQSGWITTGPKTKQFEKEIAQVCHTDKAVCLNSATAALEMTLRVLGIGEGDEVITSSYTYTASASPITHVGAKVVLVDIQKDSFEMDYQKLEEAITEKTKAIIPVDLAGIVCDYDKIFEIIEKKKSLFHAKNDIQKLYNRIIVVADSAHGIGAQRNGKMSGEWADFTTFSFHAVKNLTTAEGGAAVWKNKEGLDNEVIYKQYQLLSLHGQTKDALHKNGLGNWEYDIIAPYYKCNMTDIMAGIGLAQMKRYTKLLERRQQIIEKYNQGFKNLPITPLNHKGKEHTSSGHLYIIRVNGITEEQRNEIICKMAEEGVACNVHYKPLPMLTAYKNLGFDIKNYPNAYEFYQNEITLPLYTKLTDEQVDYIIQKFVRVVGAYIK
ncbi:MAG: DegT/DnrJ/EryC1/StrS family aminotransferase [Clostridia bacterium]|nr:DegT/DnrJ/EryC1/StrS family aminotransferase [Clostridia bacterium]